MRAPWIRAVVCCLITEAEPTVSLEVRDRYRPYVLIARLARWSLSAHARWGPSVRAVTDPGRPVRSWPAGRRMSVGDAVAGAANLVVHGGPTARQPRSPGGRKCALTRLRYLFGTGC